jgi:hypothetical protein
MRTIMTSQTSTFEGKSDAFFLSEYACLRKEIELLLDDYRSLERYAVVAIGVTWGWLIDKKTPVWTFTIPCLFAILGAVRAYGIHKAFGELRRYVRTIEAAFLTKDGPLGWEHFHERTGSVKGAYLFWSALILSTIGLAIFVYFHPFAPIVPPHP